ncbi:MAG TPA: response regulator [Blastocatellia bacterium]|nr:response regulator [Blastocatellia bacterium]
MAKAILLLADNDKEYLGTMCEFLERKGFKVLPAASPKEAKAILDSGSVDMAVLDLRLLNDSDKLDLSGLDVAKQSAVHIPKIILTRWPKYEDVREALGTQLNGVPPAVNFIAKQEGSEALLTAITRTLNLDTKYREVSDHLVAKVSQDHVDARRQATMSYFLSSGVALIGIAIIFLGSYKTTSNLLEVAVTNTLAVIITGAVVRLFFKRADVANDRVDQRYRALIQSQWMDKLMAACEELSLEDNKEKCKQRVIETAANLWFGPEREYRQKRERKWEKANNSDEEMRADSR